jgi:hypothetical protein
MHDSSTAALVLLAWMITSGLCVGEAAQAFNSAPQRVTRNQLCVTNGAVSEGKNGLLSIETPSARAVVPSATEQVVEIRFRYLGPTVGSKLLASGELRRQIGLKLRAQDTCNLLYVMWHIEPDTGLAVAIRRNPGMHTHAQCGARGYVVVKGEKTMKLPSLSLGESHSLYAKLSGNRLRVVADGQVTWEGSVGPLAQLDGPVGLRTDNGRFEFQIYAKLNDVTTGLGQPKACRVGSGD